MSGDKQQRGEGVYHAAPTSSTDTDPRLRDVMVSSDELEQLAGGAHHDPHSVLGAHPTLDGRTVIRTLRPEASAVTALTGGTRVPLQRLPHGVFGGIVDGAPTDYRLEARYGNDSFVVDDPYRWLPTLGDVDLHLIGEGRHENLWEVLGAHVRSYDTPGGRSLCGRWARPASGCCSYPVSATGAGTNSRSWEPTARGGRRPTRWRSPRKYRLQRRPWCSPRRTSGPTTSGCPGARERTGAPRRCRSMRCTSGPGARACRIASWPTS